MCKAPLARTFCLAATSHPREEVLLCQSVWGMGGRGEVGEVGGGPGHWSRSWSRDHMCTFSSYTHPSPL